MSKNLLAIISLLVIATPSLSAYEEIECSTDVVFTENSCNQCFDGGSKMQGDYLGLLNDLWMNVTDISKIVYKEEQLDPEMLNLDSSNVTWTQTPSSENFWKYTDEFNALYSDTEEGYILEAGKSVTWIESNLSNAYKLDKNSASEGSNIGLLVYPIATHNILADGEITINNSEHRECVLFKSSESSTDEVVTDQPKKLPEAGPADVILILVAAMLLGLGMMKFRTKS